MNFSWRNLCDNCLRVHFLTAIHYSTSACDLGQRVYSYISLEEKQNLMKSMNKIITEFYINKSNIEYGAFFTLLLHMPPQSNVRLYNHCKMAQF